MKATTLLREQHRRIESLIRHIAHERATRLPLVLQLVEELMTHLAIEDHFFLCMVADATDLRIDAYREGHACVRNAVLQAVFVEDDDAAFDARLHELGAEFDRHARAMERDLFPIVEAHVRGDDLESIGTRMQSYWDAAIGGTGRKARPSQVHAAE